MSTPCDHIVDEKVGEMGQRIVVRVCVETDGTMYATCLKCFEWVQLDENLQPEKEDESEQQPLGSEPPRASEP